MTAADLGASWHPGCPVGPADLRRVSVTYVGFDGAEHDGALVVHADAVRATEAAFDRLRSARFPIHKVVTVDHYGASDDASMADDNTSAFNCRPSTGSNSTWSQHAYGRAIDVNPLENPYVSGSSVQPPAGSAYLDRSDVRTGMAVAGGELVSAFGAVGWGWGGAWNTVKDYQHFSATGR
ncbi:MAG: M15 family metallopeptidase [Acidimicrobiales bacterium]